VADTHVDHPHIQGAPARQLVAFLENVLVYVSITVIVIAVTVLNLRSLRHIAKITG
jgi:hypothetical protein